MPQWPLNPPFRAAVRLAAAIDHRALMLLGVAPRVFVDLEWVWEVKYGGHRALAFREGRTARIISRRGTDLSRAFPEMIEALRALNCDVIIDGELTAAGADGKPDFHALRPRAKMSSSQSIRSAVSAHPATLYVFDPSAQRISR